MKRKAIFALAIALAAGTGQSGRAQNTTSVGAAGASGGTPSTGTTSTGTTSTGSTGPTGSTGTTTSGGTTTNPTVSTTATAIPVGQSFGQIVFDLTTHSIAPATMTVKAGWYTVTVRNGISLSPLNVQLAQAGQATAVMQSSIAKGKAGVRTIMQLQPGTHTLTVGSRADWTAVLTVTAQ